MSKVRTTKSGRVVSPGWVWRRCTACRRRQFVPPTQRVCFEKERNSKGFVTGYRCPGKLRSDVRKRKPVQPLVPIPKGAGLGIVLSEEYQAQVVAARGTAGRAAALKEMAKANRKVKQWTSEMRRMQNLVSKWTKASLRAEVRSQWTDIQFEAMRKRAAKAAQVSHVKRRLRKSAGAADGPQ